MKITMISNSYFPSQPEIQMTTDHYKEIKFGENNGNSDIALFYQFKTNRNSIHSISLIPDGCFDILFCCNPRTPSAILWTSPLQRRKQANFQANCEYFGIRFYPEQQLVRLNNPMKELLDQQIPLLHVLSIHPSLIEQIGVANTFQQRIEIFKNYIRSIRSDFNLDQKIVSYSVDRIYSLCGNLTIRDLSKEIGYSEQYIRRKFEEFIGFSPKQFCQVVKFQNSLAMMLDTAAEDLNIMNAIEENGFYDQAHFIRGFKKFADFTPKQYITYLN